MNTNLLNIFLFSFLAISSGCRFFNFTAKSKIINEVEGPIKDHHLGSNAKVTSVTVLYEKNLSIPNMPDKVYEKAWLIHITANSPNQFVNAVLPVSVCLGIVSDKNVDFYKVLSVSPCPEVITDKELSEGKSAMQKFVDDIERK
ncbi:MAG: hypothetical protein ABL930_11540 [Pseudobdellovibrio sp.]